MKSYIEERVLSVAAYISETNATVRACAEKFHVSKTTVHKDLCERLPALRADLYQTARAALERNRAVRHLRGGAATRAKYGNQARS